jgi:hypothetical protein
MKLLIGSGANVYDCVSAKNIVCRKVLIANGLRLRHLTEDSSNESLISFERSVLTCRSAVVSILRLQKLRRIHVGCKYAAREIAFAIWATRENEEWGFS